MSQRSEPEEAKHLSTQKLFAVVCEAVDSVDPGEIRKAGQEALIELAQRQPHNPYCPGFEHYTDYKDEDCICEVLACKRAARGGGK